MVSAVNEYTPWSMSGVVCISRRLKRLRAETRLIRKGEPGTSVMKTITHDQIVGLIGSVGVGKGSGKDRNQFSLLHELRALEGLLPSIEVLVRRDTNEDARSREHACVSYCRDN
jgi:hypothetical protein